MPKNEPGPSVPHPCLFCTALHEINASKGEAFHSVVVAVFVYGASGAPIITCTHHLLELQAQANAVDMCIDLKSGGDGHAASS